MSEDWTEKTEAPTQHRRAEARRQGNVPRSADLSAAALSLGAILLIQHYGPGVAHAFRTLMVEGLSASSTLTTARLAHLLGLAVAPLFAGLLLIGTVAHLVQVGFIFRFRAQAIDPAKGFSRIFSGRSVSQLAVSVTKLAIVVLVTWLAARSRIAELVALQHLPFADIATAGAALMIAVALRVAAALLVLGLIDYAWQKFRHERELRMTRREIRDEMRLLEGDPKAKRRRRDAAAAAETARLQRDVAKADVVVTGRGVAVAVRYDAATMTFPRVVARGRGETASVVVDAAKRHEVLIVERHMLARSLMSVSHNAHVPDRLFDAVAEVLAYSHEIQLGGVAVA